MDAATLRMDAPALSLAWMSVSSFMTVITTGISTAMDTARILILDTGAFNTTPSAPWDSTSFASPTVRSPCVVPPPTPQNTGMYEYLMMASEMAGCGVKGYTANTASASQLRIMAGSVEKIMALRRRPKIRMPLARRASSGIRMILWRSLLAYSGIACDWESVLKFAIVPPFLRASPPLHRFMIYSISDFMGKINAAACNHT